MGVEDDSSLTDKLSDDVTHTVIHDDALADEDELADEELVPDDERVVPQAGDEESEFVQSWVQADEPAASEQAQVEGDGFR